MPLAVHQKAIVMRAGLESDRRPPQAVRSFSQIDRLLLPVREVTEQLHTLGGRCGVVKSFYFALNLNSVCRACFDRRGRGSAGWLGDVARGREMQGGVPPALLSRGFSWFCPV